MKVRWAVIFALSLAVAGCIPLKQETLVSGPADPVMACDGPYGFAQADLNHEQIVLEQSYVEDPKGRRYGIRVEPHQYDIQQHFPAVRTDFFLLDIHGADVQRWSRGIWHFHFVMETNGVFETIDQQWKYWKFYYNPIIHGPPN
jgi:hypothetical protein